MTLRTSAGIGRGILVRRRAAIAELLRHRIAPLRRHARAAPVPRNRPRGGRSEHGLPGRPGRPDRRARHSPHHDREGAEVAEGAVANVQRIDSRKLFGSPSGEAGLAPDSFITLDGLRRRGWKQTPSGWLVESSRPLTSEQVAEARDFAAAAGLTIETRRESSSTTPIAIATAAGALLALAILAMTVGLIRSETAGDLRTLTATGATSRIRRTLTAATAGALALLGALLGVAGAYLALAATYLDDLGYLGRIPVLPLVLIVLGVPLGGRRGRLAARRPRAARHRQARDRMTGHPLMRLGGSS